jgi:hypothetical protein
VPCHDAITEPPRRGPVARAAAARHAPLQETDSSLISRTPGGAQDALAPILARAVAQRGAAAGGGPVLQRTVNSGALALQGAGFTAVSQQQFKQWLKAKAVDGDGRETNAARHKLHEDWYDDVKGRLAVLIGRASSAAREREEAVDYTVGWTAEASDLTVLAGREQTAARADLVELIGQCSGNIHSQKIGTVVGGTSVSGKGAKKVAGLNDPSARIDRQNPPAGKYNLQYQTGGASHSCVIFVSEDPKAVVLAKLLESFDQGMKIVSPRG